MEMGFKRTTNAINEIKRKGKVIRMLRTLKTSTKSDMLALLLGWISIFAIFIAQASSNSCTSWAIEQPKIPKALIKED
ncbi:hypothetical protein JCM21531_2226 [Acetivibrio straminisolvens JCM 21531]|jgi:cyclic lactone autoinducer peptide|uniref:Cyclic lactone autoinducer peptide n=2 Tax=Acetivibrio straminisolvens TaxID=253314 RepID=W4V7G3_9FIRM|nr:hypothetical protein JCM21531_2226 [Acetivibrio straminisolvens JCM 21531]